MKILYKTHGIPLDFINCKMMEQTTRTVAILTIFTLCALRLDCDDKSS